MIFKILTIRLQGVIGRVVSNSHARFIPHRIIAENVIIATDLVRGYIRKDITQTCMIKLIYKKLMIQFYWNFVRKAMVELSIPKKFIGWMMECITCAFYYFLLNGKSFYPFKTAKGLRLDDVLSNKISPTTQTYVIFWSDMMYEI